MLNIKDRLAKLSPEQRIELLKRINVENNSDQDIHKINVIDRQSNIFPLSFAQQRVWFLEQLEGPSPVYNIPFALRLRGNLRQDILINCFNEIICRHEILRTGFININDQPSQVINKEIKIKIDLVSISKDEIEKHAIEEAHKPFKLSEAPLLRIKLLKLSKHDHVLLITIHHIISDGWSVGILVKELTQLYIAWVNKSKSPLIELPIQYVDFSYWQQNYLTGDHYNSLLEYWRKQLESLSPLLELPTDRPRPAVQSYCGKLYSFFIEKNILDQLIALSQTENVTLFMTMLSAFYILLAKYSKQFDIAVGTTIANRTGKELEELIGFFVNTLVLRAKFSNQMSFKNLLQNIKAMTLAAYEHQDLPFEQLVKALQPERSLTHTPLFQVMFELNNTPIEKFELPDLEVDYIQQEINVAKFDLTLSLQNKDNGLDCIIEYNSDIFDQITIELFSQHYQTLLKNIVHSPETHVSDLQILTKSERDELIINKNMTAADFPLDQSAHALFSLQAIKTPHSIAASCNGLTMTYYELECKSNQLAHYLRKHGVRTDERIALFLDRSIDYLIAMLGVLKAGGAFVPLDPSSKDKRMQDIVEQCSPLFILSESSCSSNAYELIHDPNKVLCMENAFKMNFPITTPEFNQYANSLAYIIYTSGSTGKPKGVMIEQRGMVNHLYGKISDLKISENDVVGQIAVQTFDVAIWQFLCPLLVGGRTAILQGDSAWEPRLLLSKIDEESITILESVPSHTKVILDEQEIASHRYNLNSLRIYITNGEPLTPEQCARWFKINPGKRMVNAYGATECSDDSHHFHIYSSPSINMPYMPVKDPLPNQQTYILDEMLEPVPVGVRGEIYFGGVGVGRGYLNEPERTALSFIPNPFSNLLGERLYKTGDIARFHKDGSIEFLGRADFQVKIRGFRIEIGEIEAVLLENSKIEACVVIAAKNERNINRLISYLIPKSYPAPTISEIQSYCSSRLPDYMIPESVIFMDEFPLSSNGKVDRKKLPIPIEQDSLIEEEYIAPRNQLEQKIAVIWSQVLGREKISVRDNFFKIGGHSLIAAELAIKLQNELKVKIELRKLFEFPTIELFHHSIQSLFQENLKSDEQNHSYQNEVASVVHYPEQEYYDLAPCQIPEWYAYQVDKLSPVYNISFNDLFFKNLNKEIFFKAWQTIFERHINFRIYFDYINGKPVQKLNSPIEINQQEFYLDYSNIDPNEIDIVANKLAYEFSNRAFDFEKGPLFHLKVAQYPDQQFQLLFVIHHIIWDETSTINLFTELAEIYNALLVKESPTLPALTLNYFDYVQWMNESIKSGVFDKHKNYWLNLYKDLPPALALPGDYPRPPVQTYNGDSISSWLPRSTIRKLLPYLQEQNVTLFMFMMTIIDLYFFRITGQKDIVIGSPIAGRDHEGFKPVLGLFATPMPIRCKLNEKMTFWNLLNHVKEQSLEAFEHHYYPCNLVIEELDHIKDLSRPKLFSVMYGVQNNKTHLYGKTEFDHSPRYFKNLYGAEANSARFDLTLVVDQWGSDIAFNCIYNTDIFKLTTIQRMMEEMVHLTDEVLNNSQLTLSQYHLITEQKQITLLEKFNQTNVDLPEISISLMIEEQTKKTPNNIAIIFESKSFTYYEMDTAANKLANYLVNNGIKAGQSVGILLAPSPNMIIAILAVIKLGCNYVPISIEYPINRIEYILSHAKIFYLIKDESFNTNLPNYQGEYICLDQNSEIINKSSVAKPISEMNGESSVYIIYTSGTTGQPKGIPIKNAGIVNLLISTQSQYQLSSNDAILFITPFTFDASVLDIFWPLSYGAKIVIPHFEINKNPNEIAKILNNQNISILQCVPILLEALIDTQIKPDNLRLVICGGALLTRTLRDRFYKQFNCKLMNHYGPTEVTVDATRFDCSQDFDGNVVPIGRPISNTKIFILDEYLNPVPIGVIGEIYISSPGLTPGYLNEEDKTKTVFINKILRNKSYKLYKSGDLGKFDLNGIIYYIGRIDKQVKVRGNRVELEEIDNALLKHSNIKRALTKYISDSETSGRLVSFIEFKNHYNKYIINNENYYLFTLGQKPELLRAINAAHASAWPIYFEGSQLLTTYWQRLYSEFTEYQIALITADNQLAAVGNSVPLYWDGTDINLPKGWDEGLINAIDSPAKNPNTLFILVGIVTQEFQGKNLSAEILNAFKIIAEGHKLNKIIVAVRPTGKVQHPELDFTTWCQMRREDGQLIDNWLRIHERVGGRIVKIALESQLIEASVETWENWTKKSIKTSGKIHLPDTLQPAEVDMESNIVRYFDPAVWVEHYLSEKDDLQWLPCDKNNIRQFLNDLLPAYMLPEIIYFLPRLPLYESGKINEKSLVEPQLGSKSAILIPPKNKLQNELALIWRTILNIDLIGITDDFFDLGGQSLKVIQMLAQIADQYKCKIPLCVFYESPTIKHMEKILTEYQDNINDMIVCKSN